MQGLLVILPKVCFDFLIFFFTKIDKFCIVEDVFTSYPTEPGVTDSVNASASFTLTLFIFL